jgi:hypothetical protein
MMNHQGTQDTKKTKAGLAFFLRCYDELTKAGNVAVHVSARRLGQMMKRLLMVTLLIALASNLCMAQQPAYEFPLSGSQLYRLRWGL